MSLTLLLEEVSTFVLDSMLLWTPRRLQRSPFSLRLEDTFCLTRPMHRRLASTERNVSSTSRSVDNWNGSITEWYRHPDTIPDFCHWSLCCTGWTGARPILSAPPHSYHRLDIHADNNNVSVDNGCTSCTSWNQRLETSHSSCWSVSPSFSHVGVSTWNEIFAQQHFSPTTQTFSSVNRNKHTVHFCSNEWPQVCCWFDELPNVTGERYAPSSWGYFLLWVKFATGLLSAAFLFL